MVYKFFDKKTGSGVSVNEQLAEELHTPVIEKLCTINAFTKYAWIKTFKI